MLIHVFYFVLNSHETPSGASFSVTCLQAPSLFATKGKEVSDNTHISTPWKSGLTGDALPVPRKNKYDFGEVLTPRVTVQNGSEDQFFISPGLSDDGQFAYRAAFCCRSKRQGDYSYEFNQVPETPDWWDDTMKESTEWYLQDCNAEGFVSLACRAHH